MQKLFDFFLFRYHDKEFLEFSRARLVFVFCVITALFSVLHIVFVHLSNFNDAIFIVYFAVFAFSGLVFLLRTSLDLNIISFLYLFSGYISAVFLIYYSGNIYSNFIPWLSFTPVAANLLINRKAAYFWLTVCISTVFAFAYLQDMPLNIVNQYDQKLEIWYYAMVYSSLPIVFLVLSMVFQKTIENAFNALREKNELISSINRELKREKDDFMAQNSELLQQKEEITAQSEFIEIKNRELLLVQDELNELINKLTGAQSALLNREAENRSILKSIYSTQLLVGELDIEGKLIKISPEATKLLQMHKDAMLGKTIQEIAEIIELTIVENVEFDEIIHGLLEGKNHRHAASIVIRGEKYWLTENFFPILDENGKTAKIMIISQDISQIKRQQQEIEILNVDLKEKIKEIENQNEMLISKRSDIDKINEELKRSNQEIQNINQNLENHVKERTKTLESQNMQLSEYAYINAHLLRGPLCSILGLVNLLEINKSKNIDSLLFHMKKSSNELKKVVDKISEAIEKGTHFDRNNIN